MMRVKGNFKPSIKPLMAILLSLLLILPFFSRITFASQVDTGNFTIEAGQIQGVMLPPKIVFVDTDSVHPRPAVEFRYQDATITGMTLYKQLDTGNGPMLVKIKSSEPIRVTNLVVTATSFSFTGACLDFSNPSEALVMKNVVMQATAMTTDSMTSNGLTLATQKGTLPAQNQAVPGFLRSIMNENSFSAEKQKASEIESAKNLLMCPASSQGDTSSSNKTPGVLTTVSKTEPILKTIKKHVSAIDPSDLNKPVGQVDKTITDTTGTVTKTVGQVDKTVTDTTGTVTKTVGQVGKTVTNTTGTVTKTVGEVKKTTTDASKTITKTANQLKLEQELSQLQTDFANAQKSTEQLAGQLDAVGQTVKDDQTTLNGINDTLSNPFNIGKIGEELLALGQLHNQLNDSKSQLDQLQDQESKEQQVYLDIKRRAQNLGSSLNTDDLKSALDKNQKQLSALTQQFNTLTDSVQALLSQFS